MCDLAVRYKQQLLRAISLPSFTFAWEPLDQYWRTRATSGMSRELLEFTGDGYLIRCVLRVLYWRWPNLPVPFITHMAHLLVSNLCFCSILLRTCVIKYAITTPTELKSAADTFEAYVGAYFRQRGEERLDRFICANFGPLAESLVPACYEDYRLHGKSSKRRIDDVVEAECESWATAQTPLTNPTQSWL
ncbi:ribonuclease III domain-containing protein [Mycena capillaripes]|nr:ribonuclease III domain-containing protein [Mycena capillaripes]